MTVTCPRILVAISLMVLSLPGAERFPKPSPETAFAELKILDAQGSPVRTAQEDWEGARAKASDDWRPWIEQRRAAVDAWIQEPRDKPEYVAGWWHDFVNPIDGGFLDWTTTPPAGATPKVFGGWVFGLRSRNGSNMIEAARLWRITQDQRYFDWAAGQLDFYAESYANWPLQTEKSKARLMHQSLDDANMLVRFVETARILEVEVPEAHQAGWEGRKQRWISNLFRPMTLLLDETFQRVHNIACWQRAAMAMAAIYTGDDELWARAVDGEFGIRRQVRDGITSDYLWLEQSLGYNSYVVSAFLPLLHMAGITGRLDELRAEAAAIENLMLAPSVLRFPNGRLPTPADTTGSRKWPDGPLLANARRVFPTHIGLFFAQVSGRNWEQLLDPVAFSAPDATAQRDPAPVVSRNLESSRMAVLKQDEWQVYFHYGQLDRSHAQAEALNYEAFHGSTDVTHDAGTVGYGSPLHTGYYRTAAAHNVPIVDGAGQEGWHEGELLGFDAATPRVGARQSNYRSNASATRWLSIQDGALVETTTIDTTDGKPHRLGILLHVQGTIEAPEAAAPTQTTLPYWENARGWQSAAPSTVKATIGGKRLRLQVTASAPITIVHATTPDAPPNKREALCFEVDGTTAEFQVRWIPE